jgi:type II secretory pathway component PulF
MNDFNPANYLAFALLGAALLWAVRLAYGRRPGASDDLVKRVLLLAGWILLLAGTLGVIVGLTGPLAVLPVAGLIVVGLVYFKYMGTERRALLWGLATAAEKGIPLEEAARAFADERSVQVGVRVTRLADLLESGVPLPTALAMSRNPLPSDALLAARLGVETGQMGPALRMSIRHNDYFERIMREVMAKYFYVTAILIAGVGIVNFLMLKIVPVWVKMFEEFELELPSLTQLNVALAEDAMPAIFLVYPVLLVMLLVGVSYYVRWSRYELPLFNRLWLRCDGALVMRALALAVRQQRPLGAAIYMLAQQYPYPSVGKRLSRASAQIDNGVNWCEALHAVGLLTWPDAALIKAAERVGNLPWALEELSESALRRLAYRLRVLVSIGFPLVILLCGLLVFMIVVGMFLPLISMIQALS